MREEAGRRAQETPAELVSEGWRALICVVPDSLTRQRSRGTLMGWLNGYSTQPTRPVLLFPNTNENVKTGMRT